MSQAITSNSGTNVSGVDHNLNQVQQESQNQQVQVPHQPSMFKRILGGMAGIAGNMFAPGLGGALGSLIGGSGISGGIASGFASNAADLVTSNQLLAVAQQSNQLQEETALAANVQKSKHQTLMSVIQSIN
jgi:hypothetical protein